MFTFDSTLSGTTANSYVAVADADDYFTGHLEGTTWWATRTTVQKQAALVQATYRLDREQFGGAQTVNGQRLQWPRQRIITRPTELDYVVDYYRPSTTIPLEMQNATFEMALNYIKKNEGEFTMDDDDLETMDRLSIGPLDMTMRKNMKADRLPTKVISFLKAIGPNGWIGERLPRLVL